MSDFLIELLNTSYYLYSSNPDVIFEFSIHKRHWNLNEYIIQKTIYDEVSESFLCQYAVYCDDVNSPKFGFYGCWYDFDNNCENYGEFVEL